MTVADLWKDYFLEKVEENPEIELDDLLKDKSADDEWIQQQEQEELTKKLAASFKAKPKVDDFEVVRKGTV